MKTSLRILGVDPGSRMTGYGILDTDGFRHTYVASGHISVQGDSLAERLGYILSELGQHIEQWHPDVMAIEQVFVNKNADSALKLGQARGAAICAAVQAGLDVCEYTPRAIKKAVSGTGAAEKQQIQAMMKRLLNITHKLQSDEADGLAIAMCHANHAHARATGLLQGVKRGRWV